jgi:hypothetical protein
MGFPNRPDAPAPVPLKVISLSEPMADAFAPGRLDGRGAKKQPVKRTELPVEAPPIRFTPEIISRST